MRLVRGQHAPAPDAIAWNPGDATSPVNPAQLEGFDAVIHLSGADIARRWTSSYKREIVASRVGSTRALSTALNALTRPPRVLLVASGVGVYGTDCDDAIMTEESPSGPGFLAEVCRAWEDASRTAGDAGIRVVAMRFGVVLASDGGALRKMLPAFRLGIGGRLGSGDQWMSWISLRDLVRAVFFLAARDDLSGAFNLTAPNPVTNRSFTRALAGAVHRPALLPVPRTALRMIFGEMADETILASQRVIPERLQQAGFRFEDEEVGPTLRALLG